MLKVSRATPTVQVTDASGTFTGKAFTATATVTGLGGAASASLEGVTPTLTYYVGTSATGTPRSGPPSQGGTYTVVAAFPGSSDYEPVQSAVTFTIEPAASSISLTASATSTAYGQSITFMATVTGPDATPGGTVTFSDGVTVLGTAPVDTSGQATLITRGLPAGDASVTGSYGGDADFAPAASGSVAVSVTQAGTQTVALDAPTPAQQQEVRGLRRPVGPVRIDGCRRQSAVGHGHVRADHQGSWQGQAAGEGARSGGSCGRQGIVVA